jgi:transcriptional regulator with GAF, ATPase, and Fis domain
VTLREALDAAAREAIRAALRASNGNVRAAARSLDVSHDTVQRYVERLGLRAELDGYTRSDRQPPR